MEPSENPNWKFGQKAPMPDNLLLSALHNLLNKNSISSMGPVDRKGITSPDFEKAFLGDGDDKNEVAALYEDMSTMEFEKPDLRTIKKQIGRDKELFDMVTKLADPHFLQ